MSDEKTTPDRPLGTSGQLLSAIGFGAWAIGGPAYREGRPVGWGEVDDDESVAAINAAIDAGITFIDSAPGYGAGHSERVVGRAIASRRGEVVIGTKFGYFVDEEARTHIGDDASPAAIVEQCDQSLERLGIERIDLYQFHLGSYDPVQAEEVLATVETLVEAGKVRWIGWSTDDPERIAVFAKSPYCMAAQVRFNLVEGSPAVVDTIERLGLTGVVRSPLAMGALTGKFSRESTFASNDIRGQNFDLTNGKQARALDAIERVRGVLTSDGRTLAQGALCWLLARSSAFVPIPGIRTVAQAKENASAMAFGPLSAEQMAEVDAAAGALRVD